jgi:hypothetical protein
MGMRLELGEAPEIVRSLIETQWGAIDAIAEAVRSRPAHLPRFLPGER